MRSLRPRWLHLIGLSLLALAVGFTYARVLFTPLIPASGDFLAYFAPYWQQFNQSLRAGHLPLWNPYIFGGAPFQANPQTEVFYPLRWLMIPLSAEKGILVSDALHAWLAGALGYGLVWTWLGGRHGSKDTAAVADEPFQASTAIGVAWAAALTAGLVLALNGWATGLLLHPNQFSAYPWLLAAIWLWERRPHAGAWPRWDGPTRRWLVGMVLVWSMAFLAGHTQSFYNAAVIFGLWMVGDMGWRGWQRWQRGTRGWALMADAWPWVLVAWGLVALLTAVQILPTLELSQLSYRQGGLPYRDHAALSLPPWRLGFSLLPHYARDMGMALGTEAYGEWMGYVGWMGLLLALMGWFSPRRRLRWLGLLLVGLGLILALGVYGLLDVVLYHVMPGWDLFRVPARFLQAVVLGMAVLAALGLEVVYGHGEAWRGKGLTGWGVPLAGMLGLGLLALATRPNLPTVVGWTIALASFALLVWGWRRGRGRVWGLGMFLMPILLLAELYLGSYVLPIQHPTAPQALRSWRTAPARIASELGPSPRDAACRTLSLSPTTWDPGDLAELQTIYGPYLDDWAMRDLVNATKAKEVVAPNLGMIVDLPSLDGFGGGVLPTARFVKAMGLFLPPDTIVADGRLREQLSQVPDPQLLSLYHVCYLITGKNFDVWHDHVYYDLAFGAWLTADAPSIQLDQMPLFPISGVGVVSYVGPEAAHLPKGTPVAEVKLAFVNGQQVTFPLRVGMETAVGEDEVRPADENGLPAVRWPYHQPGQDTIATLDVPPDGMPQALGDRRLAWVEIRLVQQDVRLFVRGMAVYDRASGAHATPVVTRSAWRRIHSGDVKVYRNDGVLPRAWAVQRVKRVANLDEAVAWMTSPVFDPQREAVVESMFSVPENLASAQVTVQAHTPESVTLRYASEGEALLVLADAWHPGWEAELDPEGSAQWLEVFPVDIFLRGVVVPPGHHTLVFRYRPTSFRWGIWLSVMTLVGLAGLWLWR